MSFLRIPRRAAIGSVSALAAGLAIVVAPAANAGPPNPGWLSVSPSSTVAGAPTTLTFGVDPRGLSHNGQITLSIPAGWTAPQRSDSTAPGYVTAASAAGCSPSVSGTTITLSGGCLSGKSVVITVADETNTSAGSTEFGLTATGATTHGQATTGDAAVTVTPAVPAHLVFSQQPGDTGVVIEPDPMPPVWHPFDPPVAVTLYDAYGNLAIGYPDQVSIEANPNWNGTTSVTADPTTATATFPGVSDGSGGCEIAHMLKTMTVDDTDRGISAVSAGYCSRHDIDQGQLGGGG